MDIAVLNAIKKWPDVPDVYGWLSLNPRGNWLIKGDPIINPVICDFIGRNYSVDSQGRWFFQNGPQRVFVSLAYAPFVLRTFGNENVRLVTHTGVQIDHISGVWIDEAGQVILRWSEGVGSVSDRDLPEFANWFTDAGGASLEDDVLISMLESRTHHGLAGFWLRYAAQLLPVGRVLSRLVPQKFAFDRSPRPAPGQADC